MTLQRGQTHKRLNSADQGKLRTNQVNLTPGFNRVILKRRSDPRKTERKLGIQSCAHALLAFAVVQRRLQVVQRHRWRVVNIGDRPGEPKRACEAACREEQSLRRVLQVVKNAW